MTTTELQTECSQGERINSFLANRLDPPDRQAFVAHLGGCEACASLLRDLREDERLGRIPLTAEERCQIQAIVREVRDEVVVRLEEDTRNREPNDAVAAAPSPPSEPSPPLDSSPQSEPRPQSQSSQGLTPPGLAVLTPSRGQVLWLSITAALALAAALWVAVERLNLFR